MLATKCTTMRNKLMLLIILLASLSCKKNDTTISDPKLLNCSINYLKFQDDYRFLGKTIFFNPFDSLQVSYTYKGDKIVECIGGFQPVPSGNNFFRLLFSSEVRDSIAYKGDSVCVYTKPGYTYFESENPQSPTIYVYSQNRLQKLIRRDGFEVNYTYTGNQIVEKNSNGIVLRTLYFENNNLVKIVKENINTENTVVYKKEIFFNEFDNNPNPLKNKYYLLGAFYRAFSENNYKSTIENEYYLIDDTLRLTGTYTYSMQIRYNSDGYPMFGDYK